MPYTQEHKRHSRERILRSAARMFTGKGFDHTSIDEIMADAGMTRGAFYAHFDSKSALYAEALLHAAANSRLVRHGLPKGSQKQWFREVLRGYLNKEHVRAQISPCPMAFLATDVALGDPEARAAYTTVFRNLVKRIGENTADLPGHNADAILAITAMMIGGVAVGRALDDVGLMEQLLKSCQRTALSVLENGQA